MGQATLAMNPTLLDQGQSASMPKHLALVTDAWEPQVNGVVRTYQQIVGDMRRAGWRVTVIHPGDFRCIPMPSDPLIAMAVNVWPRLTRRLKALKPDYIHLATEGPLGMTARKWCGFHNYRFTTSYHSKFPEFIQERMGIPLFLTYGLARWFHNRAAATLVPTPSLMRDLKARGFTQLKQWTHGVDVERFNPSKRIELDYPRPIALYVGRVSVEKNLEAFLKLTMAGTKLVVGDGPERELLETRYPEVVFLGIKQGEELPALYACADIFVFPSRTDTFGLVLLEALASGTPIAGFPVTGPIDVANDANVGGISEDLAEAIEHGLKCSRAECRSYAERFSWASTVRIFVETLVPMLPPPREKRASRLMKWVRKRRRQRVPS
jgi:glycosyltransferase involved in cell wall biosynthesis